MTVSAEEITGPTEILGRVMDEIVSFETRTGEVAKHVFMGENEWEELRKLAETWEHKWPIPNQRPEVCGKPIYIVNAKSFLAVA